MTNFVPRQYREVSVASVDFPLTAQRLRDHFLGREVYKRTRYVVVRHGPSTAIVALETAPGTQVMTVAVEVNVLALPHECAFIHAPEADTGLPTSLAAAAQEADVGRRGVVVEGRYRHINFLLDPSPVPIRVVDVVPPQPAKLVDQVARVLAVAEDLPPISVVPWLIDLGQLAAGAPAPVYLLPCRGSGFLGDGTEVAFLDERPPRRDWTLIGCARSRELHRWFYGDVPPAVDMCPRALAGLDHSATVTLTKCCLLEDRIDLSDDTVVVPWGASLAQVRQGLEAAAALGERLAPAPTPITG